MELASALRITSSARRPEDVQANALFYKRATIAALREHQHEQTALTTRTNCFGAHRNRISRSTHI
jgi:hypothetical protein